jgi:tetratricopeptide (TPR) repeat protein
MNVPFHLRRRADAEPATALFLPTAETAPLLDLCVRCHFDPLPPIFAVSGGFLLVLGQPTNAAFPGAVRLRSLCPHLFLPTDADLVPPLHDDEARALVRDRGLLFLPGGQILAFAPGAPIALSRLVEVRRRDRRSWQTFPSGPARADRLRSVEVELPPPSIEELLQPGSSPIGIEEPPRPAGAGLVDTMAGNINAAAGKGLIGLGNLFGWKSLADMGARLVQEAVEKVPRLTESLLSKQEAALRELLREFREGDLERALRHALPMGGDGGRGATAHPNAQLPGRDPRYSLSGLLGNAGGRASIWFGGEDIQRELAKEYRQAADRAIREGDHRRAAYIHGRLLNDYRRAADILSQGGLHHDAALLYLNRVGDRAAAARAFEAAGEVDNALRLYRELHDHIRAGDLLKRIGEEDAAIAEYTIAAEAMVAAQNFLGAGELMITKAGRRDRAREYLRSGCWLVRPGANGTACAERLARLYAEDRDGPALVELTGEARRYFDPAGSDTSAAQFYNLVAGFTREEGLAAVRDELRDLTRLGLAVKLRQRAAVETRQGDVVSQLMGRAGAWPVAVVSDAEFALRQAIKVQPTVVPARTVQVRLGTGEVTAVCAAPATGRVFAAFDTGEIVMYVPASDEVVQVRGRVENIRVPASSMSTDADGDYLVVLWTNEETPNLNFLGSFGIKGNPRALQLLSRDYITNALWLSPLIVLDQGERLACVYDGDHLNMVQVPKLHREQHFRKADCIAAEFLPAVSAEGPVLFALFPGARWWQWANTFDGFPYALPSDHVSWLPKGNHLEWAGTSEGSGVTWAELEFRQGHYEVTASVSLPARDVEALTIPRPGLIAVVTRGLIRWATASSSRLIWWNSTPLQSNRSARCVGCFRSLLTGEVLVVTRDGYLERVPVPVSGGPS